MKPELVLLNDFTSQWEDIREPALKALDRVGGSGWLILGNEVAGFERELATFASAEHCIGVANGMDAIEISLRALGLKPEQKVLTTPLSAFATTLAILRAGGRPVFVDTDKNGLIDLEIARETLSKNPDIRFMVPVHLFGHSVDARKLQSLKTDFDLLIVEDCAQSIGAYSHGNQVGGVGQMSATSFYPTKNLGCMGDGGAIFTNDQQLADLSKKLRDYGQSQKYVHAHLGLNSRLDELQAAILRDALLPKLGSYTEIRRKIAAKYCAEISNPRIAIVKEPPNSQSVWHLFPVLISEDRESFQNHLSQKGISCGVHYPILITAQPALGSLRQDNSCYPAAHAMTQQEVSLPIHPYLTETHIGRVIEACNSW